MFDTLYEERAILLLKMQIFEIYEESVKKVATYRCCHLDVKDVRLESRVRDISGVY